MTDHPKTSKSCAESRTDLCQGAETCLRFRGHLCTGGRNVPQIQGRLLPGVHSLPRVLGQINQDENGKLRDSGGTVLHSMGYVVKQKRHSIW